MRMHIGGLVTYVKPIKPGEVMRGMGVSEVIYSNDPKFKKGDKVLAQTYW
jgi:NADPH-dependent curcumin reductase CurA